MKWIIAAGCLGIISIIAVYRHPIKGHNQPTQAPPTSNVVQSASQAVPGVKLSATRQIETNGPTGVKPIPEIPDHSPQNTDDGLYTAGRFQSDPTFQQRVLRHINIRYYHDSPARETPECQQIVALLTENGVGLEAVGDVYNAVWDYQQMIRPFVGIAAKQGEMELIRDRFSRVEVERLRAKHGITKEAFFQAVFSLRPTIPFGLKRLTMQEGEQLYE